MTPMEIVFTAAGVCVLAVEALTIRAIIRLYPIPAPYPIPGPGGGNRDEKERQQ